MVLKSDGIAAGAARRAASWRIALAALSLAALPLAACTHSGDSDTYSNSPGSSTNGMQAAPTPEENSLGQPEVPNTGTVAPGNPNESQK